MFIHRNSLINTHYTLKPKNLLERPTTPSQTHPIKQATSLLFGYQSKTYANVARMPDGRGVTLTEKTDSTSRIGVFTFKDPKTKWQNGQGKFEYDALITPTCVDLQNIFNSSYTKGALDLVISYLTHTSGQKTYFKITGIEEDDLFEICKNYQMRQDGPQSLIGDFETVKYCSTQRLLRKDKKWDLHYLKAPLRNSQPEPYFSTGLYA